MTQQNQAPKISPAQAFNMVAPAARQARLTGEEHEVLFAALLVLKDLAEKAENEAKAALEATHQLKAVDAPAEQPADPAPAEAPAAEAPAEA